MEQAHPTPHPETESYAGVRILDNPFCIDEEYHYYIPPTLCADVIRGAFVTVPFGKGNRKQLGLVVSLCDASRLPAALPPDRVKPVGGVCRERLFLSEKQLSLCFYLTETTLCTMGEAVRTVVPAAALATLVEYFRATAVEPTAGATAAELLVLEYIRTRGTVSLQGIKNRFGAKAAEAVERLCDHHLVERELAVKETTLPTVRHYSLARSHSEIEAALRGERGAIPVRSDGQRAILRVLLEANHPMSEGDLIAALHAAGSDVPFRPKTMLDKGLLSVTEVETYRTLPGNEPAASKGEIPPFELNDEQSAAVETLSALATSGAASGEGRAALLHGVTGSGKTCVILSMIDRMLDAGRGSIVLLPEIALTPQMLAIFHARYGHRVAVIHSGLSAGERLDSHRRILAGDAPVVVGTRSAVFAPVPRLGMIVMDEEQEHTYKSDMDPKYHARDIARFRCATEGALLLLSSATPSLESYHKAVEGKYTLITMKKRYGAAVLPTVRIVDMRGEPGHGNLSPLGEVMTEELSRVLAEREQAVLFLNRRGYSHQLICRSCGHAVTCPRCSVAMHVHMRSGRPEGNLVCHWCGTRGAPPATCPDCGSPHLVRMGYGTQRIEEDLGTLLPDARIMRMDADTTTTKSAYSDLLGAFRRHEADILLGTQMVTKGHDFPDVTLVGVLMADQSLYLDDFRAGERTFSMLTQVIGRAGRGNKPGLALIQTMNPDHEVLRLACAQDYRTFYEREIRLRRLLQFPPFCDMVLLTLTSAQETDLQAAALRLSEEVRRLCDQDYADIPLMAFGPFEAPVYRVDNIYRMRMVLKCRISRRARALLRALLCTFSSARGAKGPVLSVDINPSHI